MTNLPDQIASLRAKIANDRATVTELSNIIRNDEFNLTLLEDQVKLLEQLGGTNHAR